MTKFADIGKPTNDLLTKDFPINVIKFEAKGAEKTGANFLSKLNVTGSRDNITGNIQGEIKNTLTCLITRPVALTKEMSQIPMVVECTSTLNTDGSLTEQVELKDPLLKGLNISATGQLVSNGPLNVKANLTHVQGLPSNMLLTNNLVLDLAKGGKFVAESAIRYNSFVLGSQLHFGTAQAACDNFSGVVGYDSNQYKATLHAMNKGTLLAASFYQRFTSGVETGFKATWNRKTANQYGIELVGKFPLDHGTSLKCKVDNGGKLGFAYSTPLNHKLTMTLGVAVDTMKLEAQNHRLGLGLLVDL